MRKILVIAPILMICAAISFVIYPMPRFFWSFWHRDEYNAGKTMAEYLGEKEFLSNELRCWEVTNSRCGFELIFVTPLSLAEFKDKVSALGLETKLDRETDGDGLFGVLSVNGGIIDYQGSTYSTSKPLIFSTKTPESWGYWLVNSNGKNVYIDYFSLPEEPITLNNTLLSGGVIRLIYNTRGR